jgi:pimeloyl-ACP methyl ester carboxylesterase
MARGSGFLIRAGVPALLAVGLASTPGLALAAPLEKCERRSPAQCGHLTVPLDRTGAVPGKVKLSVARIPARKQPSAGTVMLIAGGPGESAIGALALTGRGLAKALPRFDVVAFDQRGTGRSGRLRCRALRPGRAKGSVAGAFARCAKQLGPRRAFYRTTDSVDDLEAVRSYLGAPRLSLLAVSYGARLAGEYVRRYPASAARLVLDSPVALTGTDPFNRQVQLALPRVLAQLCADRACPFSASPFADLQRLAQRLTDAPLRGHVVDGRGRSRRAALTARTLHALVSASDLDPILRSRLPGGVAAALKGDPAPLLRAASGSSQAADALSVPLTAATLCSESPLPWDAATPPGAARSAALRAALDGLGMQPFAPFAPRTVVRGGLLSICERWPALPSRPAPASGQSAVPTLVLSGAEDLRTPSEQARAVAAGYDGAALLEVPQTGHSVITAALRPCASRALVGFLRGGAAPSACPRRPRPSLVAVAEPPGRLAAVPGGSPGQRLRAAARLTARDAVTELLAAGKPRFGGLRGGSARVERRGIVLTGYVYVRGVAVSGTLRPGKGNRVRGNVEVAVRGSAPLRVKL